MPDAPGRNLLFRAADHPCKNRCGGPCTETWQADWPLWNGMSAFI